jgi:DNA-binding Lrp family transcriptional regulator
MEHHKLDSIDLRILSELQADGRITNVELSRRAKITAPPCLRRMRALEKAGYIKGYHADLDGKSLGYEVTSFVFVGLSSQNEADLKRFEEQARVLHALRRGRFSVEVRGEGPVVFSVLHNRNADRGEECGQCEILAGHSSVQARTRCAGGSEVAESPPHKGKVIVTLLTAYTSPARTAA